MSDNDTALIIKKVTQAVAISACLLIFNEMRNTLADLSRSFQTVTITLTEVVVNQTNMHENFIRLRDKVKEHSGEIKTLQIEHAGKLEYRK